MHQFINQYSAIWLSALLILGLAFILFRQKSRRNFVILGVLVAGLAAAWFIVHPIQTPLMAESQAVQNKIGAGTPVLLEFQSPY